MAATYEDIGRAIRQLALPNKSLCVHSSLRSFEHLEGGADALIDAFLDAGCTLLVPTFTEGYEVPPPPGFRIQRNGSDWYAPEALLEPPRPTLAPIFSPLGNSIDQSMGAMPRALLARGGRVRGNHPLNSFAALGPRAAGLVGGQTRINVYDPFRALVGEGGKVLLIGVGLQRMTLIHLAEQQAGRTLFRRHALDPDGNPVEVAVGSCSKGFGNFDSAVLPLATSTQVGQSTWRVFDPTHVLNACVASIRDRPSITHCGEAACIRCNDAVLGGPILA